MSSEIPVWLRKVDQPRRGGHIVTLPLPKYVVAMHVAETAGFGGSCSILGFPGDHYEGESGHTIPKGKVRAELVTPQTLSGKIPLDSFWSMVEDRIYELERAKPEEERIILEASRVDLTVPDSLRIAYAQAKRMVASG